VKERGNLWRELMMGDLILGKHGLSDQHVEQATQSTLQGDFAWLTIFMGLPASQFGQQLYFPRIAQRVEGYSDLCPVAGEKQAPDRARHILSKKGRLL